MSRHLNSVVGGALAAVAGFVLLRAVLPLEILTAVLNGLFLGAMATVAVAYGPLFINAVTGVSPYDRVRQMTVGFAACWFAYLLAVFASVYSQMIDGNATVNGFTAASRYAAILAACLQVTAPDFGLGIFHGRDRKVLWTGMLVGVAVAAVTVLAQREAILAG